MWYLTRFAMSVKLTHYWYKFAEALFSTSIIGLNTRKETERPVQLVANFSHEAQSNKFLEDRVEPKQNQTATIYGTVGLFFGILLDSRCRKNSLA